MTTAASANEAPEITPYDLIGGEAMVRRLADRMRVLSSARGTRATVTFNLPGQVSA